MVLWGLHRPVMPWCTDGPIEAELGAWQETTMSDWADRCHEQGGTVVVPHFPQPNGEPATLIATGRADAVEMIVQRPACTRRVLRLPERRLPAPARRRHGQDVVGGAGRAVPDLRVPRRRGVLVRGVDRGRPSRQDVHQRQVRSCGSRLTATRIGRRRAARGGGTVTVEATAESVFPMASLELVRER